MASSSFLLKPRSASDVLNSSSSSSSKQEYAVSDTKTLDAARAILEHVREFGLNGLLEKAKQFNDIASLDEQIIYKREDLKKAFDALPKSEQELLTRTAQRITSFAQAQRSCITPLTVPVPGGMAGHEIAPVQTAGCYAPGGGYPLPSSVLMTVLTARAAGVKNVIVASPKASQVTMAAAFVSNADFLIKLGGAQAIGAMAYGVKELSIPACDIIVGPGNRYVTAAKQLVSGTVCGIDMLAGPSECLVLCDNTSDAKMVAADLLAQAEHDADAIPMMVTYEEEIVRKVQDELRVQLDSLPTQAIARKAVTGKGFYCLCRDLNEAIAVCDAIGSEHLEVFTKNATEDAKKLNRFGGLFVGPLSAEVFGDYGAGPNHVLPTSNTAKYTGGLSVFTFLRIRTWLRLEDAAQTQALVSDSAQLARLEGLEGHARSAECRLLENNIQKKQKKM